MKRFLLAFLKNIGAVGAFMGECIAIIVLGVLLNTWPGIPFWLTILGCVIICLVACAIMEMIDMKRDVKYASLKFELDALNARKNEIYQEVLEEDNPYKRDELYTELDTIEENILQIEKEILTL